jgi:hypothetical protein
MDMRSDEKLKSISFSLAISADKYKAYYQGQVQAIQVQSHDGRSIRFPANAIRQFVTADGVRGEFVMEVDGNNKLVGIRRRSEA